jgi:hypothetical protein
MTLETIIDILKCHNNWRRGKTDKTPYTVKELGKAIDEAIKLLESKKTIALNPDWCQHPDTCINKVCIGHPRDCEEDNR